MVSILCSIIRTKFVALWLGPAGVGLFGLYNNVVDMISSFSNLGMRDSCVRNIASEKSSYAIAVIITVVRRWAMMLGALGSLIALILSPILSFATFGDYEHIWGFVALSVVFLINSLTLGEEAVLQGTARLRRLARASICGVVAGMLLLNQAMGFVAILGVMALSGMIIRNSIILIDQIQKHIEAGEAPRDAIVDSAVLRFRPIMLTAAAAILGMLPLMTSSFWGPMAVAIASGLLIATILTLLVLPVMYAVTYKIH